MGTGVEYTYILIYMLLSIIISIVIFLLSYFLVYQSSDFEKISSYECGFSPFNDARSTFEVKFYLISILFIIFDLEIIFLFPWIIGFPLNGKFSIFTMMIFVFILTLGFIYEWKKGVLDWSKKQRIILNEKKIVW